MLAFAAESILDAEVEPLIGAVRTGLREITTTSTATGIGIRGPGGSSRRSRNLGKEATSRASCSHGAQPRRRWSWWSRRPTSMASRRGRPTIWSRPWAWAACRRAREPAVPEIDVLVNALSKRSAASARGESPRRRARPRGRRPSARRASAACRGAHRRPRPTGRRRQRRSPSEDSAEHGGDGGALLRWGMDERFPHPVDPAALMGGVGDPPGGGPQSLMLVGDHQRDAPGRDRRGCGGSRSRRPRPRRGRWRYRGPRACRPRSPRRPLTAGLTILPPSRTFR